MRLRLADRGKVTFSSEVPEQSNCAREDGVVGSLLSGFMLEIPGGIER